MFATDLLKYVRKFLYCRNDNLFATLDEFSQIARMLSVTYGCANLHEILDRAVQLVIKDPAVRHYDH